MTTSPTSTDPPTAAEPEPPEHKRSGLLHGARELVIVVVVALVASALIRAFVAQAFFVPTGSMLPEIQLNDKILVSRIGGIHRGEVVVFEDPGHWIPESEKTGPPGTIKSALEFVGLLPQSSDNHLVKRIIGLPGDEIVCCTDGGDLTVNGKAIDESSYLLDGEVPADDVSFDVIVPADHIFVLGDNRLHSGDSAYHLPSQEAFVPESLVTGRAVAVIWPWGDAHVLHIPAVFADIPAGQDPPGTGIIKSFSRQPAS